MTRKDPHTLNEEGLQEYSKELGLDSSGPKTVVLDRIIRHLKQHNQYQPVERKKRSKKKKTRHSKVVEEDEVMRDDDTVVEIVQEEPAFEMPEFKEMFTRFQRTTMRRVDTDEDQEQDEEDMDEEDDEEANLEDREQVQKGKKKLRKMHRMTVAQLKQIVKKPEVVEVLCVDVVDRCHVSGSVVVDFAKIYQKYCTCSIALGPKAKISARKARDGEAAV